MSRLIRDEKMPSVVVYGVSYVARATLDAFEEFAQFRMIFLDVGLVTT